MISQLFGTHGFTVTFQISRARYNGIWKRSCETHGDHVGRNELAKADACVKATLRQIDHLLARNNLQLDIGITAAKGSD